MAIDKEKIPNDHYILLQVTPDGPSRVNGKRSYMDYNEAVQDLENHCRELPKCRFMIAQIKGHYWLNPKPKILDNLPKDEPRNQD